MMNTLESRYIYKQLNEIDCLTDKQLEEIAGLVYDTDPYIYPAMFGNRDNAITIIPEMYRLKDGMFSLSNTYIALDGNLVIGMILWKRGNLKWNTKTYWESLKRTGIKASPHIRKVIDEYFADYDQIDCSIVSIINVCVDSKYQGQGVCTQMMKQFFAQFHSLDIHYKKTEFELYVLDNNPSAIHVYEKLGFEIVEKLDGFSIETEKPLCLKMAAKIK